MKVPKNQFQILLNLVLFLTLAVPAPAVEAPSFLWPLSRSEVPDVINSPFGPRTRRTGTMYEFQIGRASCRERV